MLSLVIIVGGKERGQLSLLNLQHRSIQEYLNEGKRKLAYKRHIVYSTHFWILLELFLGIICSKAKETSFSIGKV